MTENTQMNYRTQVLDAARVFWQQHTKSDALSMTMAELHDDVELVIRAARGSAQALDARWVSAKDRLPDPFCEVLVHPRPTDYCCEGSVNTQGEWSYGEYEHHFGHNSIKCNVTHWMPLPTPPVAIAAKQGGQ